MVPKAFALNDDDAFALSMRSLMIVSKIPAVYATLICNFYEYG